MQDVIIRLGLALCLCVAAPALAIHWIVHNLELTWWNIFMVSGLESFWVYLCWDMSKWVRQAWEERP